MPSPGLKPSLLSGIAFASLATAACGAQTRALPGENAPSSIVIAGESEPGTPLRVEGTVYAPDGETPAPGVVLYVYQTDLTGLYHPNQGSGVRSAPRLRGYVKTDARGRYSYRTIRPASYPNSTNAAHIHTQLWGGGYDPQWNQDLNFADDPYVSAHDKSRSAAAGRFAWICAAEPDAAEGGLLRCTHNLRLKPEGDRFESNTRHGLDGPAN
jgi:protocatechuate 3,4-dioxygenase, beta subunit